MSLSPLVAHQASSIVRIRKHGFAAFGEGKDALDAVGMDDRAPVLIHHDLDRLLDRLALPIEDPKGFGNP
jgi:hypothetical protein